MSQRYRLTVDPGASVSASPAGRGAWVLFSDRAAVLVDAVPDHHAEPFAAGVESDSSWFAGVFAAGFIEAFEASGDTATAICDAVESAESRFDALLQEARSAGSDGPIDASMLEPHQQPYTSMAIAALEGDALVIARIGDTAVYFSDASGATHSLPTHMHYPVLQQETFVRLAERHDLGLEIGLDEPRALELSAWERSKINSPHDLSALTVSHDCIEYIDFRSLDLSSESSVLLLNGGLNRALSSNRSLVSAEDVLCRRLGAPTREVAAQAREILRSELPDCGAHPMFDSRQSCVGALVSVVQA
ncbi:MULTISPECIES: protein phosphatase 2C domain-containing protein [unclassified Thioalkalivibrio]|uniref:protein phosphatase 2C domain-containing protein n=1 Tax=unclassified Thioalkalivibrio TaxID=2621013 RepID=UPI000364CCA4|nr:MULTISPECIES: protein phosphatase 2C domain-containing protein [unclassified Thioalkalivibrio]